jgi:agarase
MGTGAIGTEDIGAINMKGDECVILTLDLDKSPAITGKINETFYYGDRTVVPISGTSVMFMVEVPDGNHKYAELRIGISRHNALDVVPEVKLNGKKLDVRLEESYDKQITNAQKESGWGIRRIPLPVELLKTENRIEVSFDDEGGVISSVIIKTGQS